MTDEVLHCVRVLLETRHPVLSAMATKLERHEPEGEIVVRVSFDGPALPEKRHSELTFPRPLPEGWRDCIEPWLMVCERDVAAAMRKAGYAGSAFARGEGGTCGPIYSGDAPGGGGGSAPPGFFASTAEGFRQGGGGGKGGAY